MVKINPVLGSVPNVASHLRKCKATFAEEAGLHEPSRLLINKKEAACQAYQD